MQLKMVYTIFSSHAFKKKIFLKRLSFLFILVCLCQLNAYSQCLPNIGFENGNFDHWICSKYIPVEVDNFNVPNSGPLSGFHTIFKNRLPAERDSFGGFPVTCPNGSGYSIRLGMADGRGRASAQRVSYSFTIPRNQNEYSIVVHYAIVLMNSNHSPNQEPRFTIKVFDIDTQAYIECKSLEFKASNTSFITTSFGATPQSRILYSPWSTTTINLSNMSGKNLAVEFTTSDCTTNGQHPCYAYIDVDENCSASPITGNTYCKGDSSVKLKAPNIPGGKYTWYTSDFSKMVGNEKILTLSPAPAPGTKYALVITPTSGFGCTDTLYTTVQYSGNVLDLQVKDSLQACFATGVDLTADSVTKGSSPGLTFSYFTDKDQSTLVPLAKHIQDAGSYYISATNAAGCRKTKEVSVKVNTPYIVVDNTLPAICASNGFDLTDPSVILVSSKNLVFSYWADSATTIIVSNPKAITAGGKYYIKGTTSEGCSVTSKVNVSFLPAPDFSVAAVNPVDPPATIDITALVDHTTQIQYSYWRDAQAIIALQKPEAVDSRGNYYIKGTGANGCSVIKPVLIGVTTSLQIANAFSPNNDGINDTWEIPYLQSYPNAIVEIYNRYGQIVFKSTGSYKSWDGKLNGKSLPIGTYYYIIKLNPQANPISGSITILK